MSKNLIKETSNSGFTLLEVLIVTAIIGVSSAIAVPSWLGFADLQRLKTAQDQVYRAMRQAQNQATKTKLTWQVSFRQQKDGIVQWAVHLATVNPANVIWNNLDPNVRMDTDTTLNESNGVRQIQFDYRGNVRQPPLGRITLSSRNVGKAKRCVYVSTILGTMRLGKENAKANNDGKSCY
jgi:prepilin-type N-terminal cleavage/methylation domain-containing protein